MLSISIVNRRKTWSGNALFELIVSIYFSHVINVVAKHENSVVLNVLLRNNKMPGRNCAFPQCTVKADLQSGKIKRIRSGSEKYPV